MDINEKPTHRHEWVGQVLALAVFLTFTGTLASVGRTARNILLSSGCIVAGEAYRRNQHNKMIEVNDQALAETNLLIEADKLSAREQIEAVSRKAEIAKHISQLELEQAKLSAQLEEFNC